MLKEEPLTARTDGRPPVALWSLYDQLLTRIAADLPSRDRGIPLTAFGTAVGSRWTGELLVCGRAVNGWEKEPWFADQVADPLVRRELTARAMRGWSADPCPMMWVSDLWHHRVEYNTARSAFWRVLREVTLQLGIAGPTDVRWPSYLAWTNLYRISPQAGGNPNTHLQDVQREACLSLLNSEMEALRPRRVLFFTGENWAAPFLEQLHGFALTSRSSGLVSGVGFIDLPSQEQTKVVIAEHPQGNPESAMVTSILAAFAK